jgi:hypothetical protein
LSSLGNQQTWPGRKRYGPIHAWFELRDQDSLAAAVYVQTAATEEGHQGLRKPLRLVERLIEAHLPTAGTGDVLIRLSRL